MKLEISEARRNQSNANNANGFHSSGIKTDLVKCDPTHINPDEISRQLHNIGLYCEETRGDRLKKNIEDVINHVKDGKCQVIGVYREKKASSAMLPPEIMSRLKYCDGNAIGFLSNTIYEQIADGEWKPVGAGDFQLHIRTLIAEDVYKYFKENIREFPWAEASKNRDTEVSTVDAIKSLFMEAAEACTATVIEGISRASVESIFSSALDDIDKEVLTKDFHGESKPTIVEFQKNYDSTTRNSDGVGALRYKWTIDIKNYQEKKQEPKHNVKIHVEACSILYTSEDLLKDHYKKACEHFKLLQMLTSNDFHTDPSVTVFESIPEPSIDVFQNSLPSTATYEYVDAIVFYQSDVQKLGFFDNTQSSAAASYTKSITSGFSTAFTVGLSAEVNFEMSAVVAKFGAKFGFNVSLTNQWTQTQTDTISFQIPAGKKAYLYQVTLLCARLRYYPSKIKYEYVEYGKFLSDAYKTTENPLYEDKMKG